MPGEIALLRGESGCGKSSILALLQRFYLPAEGRIFFGQYEIRYISASSLRTQIAVVPQKIDLMSGTVIENIALGECEPDMRKSALPSAQSSACWTLSSRCRKALHARLAEGRKKSSQGGQRQRLAIARALYIDAPVYVFDEPAAALDEVSENRLLNVLQGLRDLGKIVILVSHDRRLVSFADRVYTVSGTAQLGQTSSGSQIP